MTDEHDELDPASPEDDARIRALLASARETGPVPADVAARLDDTLAGLAAERGVLAEPSPATGSEASVHPLVRTRRHRVVAWVGAAAAVAVFGLGVGALLDQQSGSDSADDSAASGGSVDRGNADLAKREATGTDAPEDSVGASEEFAPWEKVVTNDRVYRVRSRHLTHDLARIQAVQLPEPGTGRYGKTLIHRPQGFPCADARWGRGVLVAARYDGDPTYVAFRQPMGDSQVVDVLQCGTAEVLRTTTLPTNG